MRLLAAAGMCGLAILALECPWTWPARPSADRGGWFAAVTVLAVALPT